MVNLQLMFQLALELMKENETAILKANDDGEVLIILQNYMSSIYEGDQEGNGKVSGAVI